MLLRSISEPLSAIYGLGEKSVKKLARLGISNIAGLLCHYPRGWEDHSVNAPIKDFRLGPVCADVTVTEHKWVGGGYKKTLKVYV